MSVRDHLVGNYTARRDSHKVHHSAQLSLATKAELGKGMKGWNRSVIPPKGFGGLSEEH